MSRHEPSWRAAAACRGRPAEWFFPEPGPDSRALIEQARQVCAGCPVRDRCLAEALATGEQLGVWGGLTPAERRRLVRRPPQEAA